MNRWEIIAQVRAIILRHARPARIWLYGSTASGEAAPESDIDIAFDDPECTDLEAIKAEAAALKTLVKIDVTNIAHAGERFRERVRAAGQVLYSAGKALRFEDSLFNFNNALTAFGRALRIEADLRKDGFAEVVPDLLVKRFEFTYEMSWKTIKRWLAYVGIEAKNPRECFREARAQGLIPDETVWLAMIEARNLSAHVYDQNQVGDILGQAGRYLAAFQELADRLKNEYQRTSDTSRA